MLRANISSVDVSEVLPESVFRIEVRAVGPYIHDLLHQSHIYIYIYIYIHLLTSVATCTLQMVTEFTSEMSAILPTATWREDLQTE
jgi:hypothetical protein